MNVNSKTDDHTNTRRSPALAVLGLAALGVAGWGLADGPMLPDAITVGWIAVGAALIIGLVLILTGARSSRR